MALSTARWLVPALLAGGVIAVVLANVPGGRTVERFLPPVGVAAIAALCFRDLARRDRVGFLSIVGPAIAVAITSVVAPEPIRGFLALTAIGFLGLFVFARGTMGAFWWRTVLRRQIANRAQTFDYDLTIEMRDWATALSRSGTLSSKDLAMAERALARMRALDAPDAEWSDLRDAYVAIGDEWLRTPRDDDHLDAAMRMQQELTDLRARQLDLRAKA